MTNQLKATTGPWKAVLTDPDGWVADSVAEILEEYGSDVRVNITIARGSALPEQPEGFEVARLPISRHTEDVAVEWELDIVDDNGESGYIDIRMDQAEAMAFGLNAGANNDGLWNRGAGLADGLRQLADKLATFDGAMPRSANLFLTLGSAHDADSSDSLLAHVDAFGTHLFDRAGERKESGGSTDEYGLKDCFGPLSVLARAYVKPLPKQNPAALLARIAELEAQVASNGATA
jgi:hypothetical protein